MKKVLLLGDSIRMGYQRFVREELEGECEVLFSPENGRFAAFTMWQVNQMFKNNEGIELVHWNNGYWDMNIEAPMDTAMHPLPEYLYYLRRIAEYIKAQGAKIVFATTVPILSPGAAPDLTGTAGSLNFKNEWVLEYNAAAKELMAELNIPVNDLYEHCYDVEKNHYKCEDRLHLSEEGSRRCAKRIAEVIREQLK